MNIIGSKSSSSELFEYKMNVNDNSLLQKCPNRFALLVLEPFIEQNEIASEQLLNLNKIIREARENKKALRDSRIAWEGLAIFALYVYFAVTDLAEIAEHICLTTSAVKRWIQAFYIAFELPLENFPNKSSRRSYLRLKAVESGLIKYPSWLRRVL